MLSLVNYENHYYLSNMFFPIPTSNNFLLNNSFIFFLLASDCTKYCCMCLLHLAIIYMQKFTFLTFPLIIINILNYSSKFEEPKYFKFQNFSRVLLYQFKYFHMNFISTTHVCNYNVNHL